MGGSQSVIQKANYLDVQRFVKDHTQSRIRFLITTMPIHNSTSCLIANTISPYTEEREINTLISEHRFNVDIIIYGANYTDYAIYSKYEQLKTYGFKHVYIYLGGMFEWLCMQDIYGSVEFPTTVPELDIIKYTPSSNIQHSNVKQIGWIE